MRSKVKENGKDQSKYLPETQKWVVSMVEKAKQLDNTPLLKDNSICYGAGHTVTDINSWHEYLPGWEWENHISPKIHTKVVRTILKQDITGSSNKYQFSNLETFGDMMLVLVLWNGLGTTT